MNTDTEGHLNYSEKIHEIEGFGTNIDRLMWYSPVQVKIVDPKRARAKAELEGLREYGKMINKLI